jgi:methyl-accepting chemotaxis protein
VVKGVVKSGKYVVERIATAGKSIVNQIFDEVNNIYHSLQGIVNWISSSLDELGKTLSSGFIQFVEDIREEISKIIDGIGKALAVTEQRIVYPLLNMLDEPLKKLEEVVSGMAVITSLFTSHEKFGEFLGLALLSMWGTEVK